MPFWKGRGLGSGLRTLPQGFLSPTRGTERVVKTIEDRWGKYSTVGRLHPSRLRRVSVPCEGNRKGRKAYCGLVRMWSSLWLKGDGGIRKTFFNGKEGRVGFRKMLFTIHPLIILLILPRSNMIHPFLVLEIPFYGLFYTLHKLARWLQTDFLLEFARIDGITPIVTLSISKVGLQYFFVQK